VSTVRPIYPYSIPMGTCMSHYRSVTGIADLEVKVLGGPGAWDAGSSDLARPTPQGPHPITTTPRDCEWPARPG